MNCPLGCQECKVVLSCCGAGRKSYEHSWDRYNLKKVNWFCSNCDADFPKQNRPELQGRKATCYCGKTIDSSIPAPGFHDIPFFEHRPNNSTDSFYCGHDGWD